MKYYGHWLIYFPCKIISYTKLESVRVGSNKKRSREATVDNNNDMKEDDDTKIPNKKKHKGDKIELSKLDEQAAEDEEKAPSPE